MKVLFTFGGLVHYYNFVLNKLNAISGLEIIVVTPNKTSVTFGEGVYETKLGVNFKHIELEEAEIKKHHLLLKGLDTVLATEKPDVVVTIEPYLQSFYYDKNIMREMKRHNIKLILKDHPFRLLKYNDRKAEMFSEYEGKQFYERIKLKLINTIIPVSSIAAIIATILTPIFRQHRKYIALKKLNETRFFFQFPDAIVCYIEDAFEIFGSYGVSNKNIFITYNSPDTDLFFAIKEVIRKEDRILPVNDHRIIHTGRLVAWKKIDLLIKAFERIKKTYHDAELLIVGYGPLDDELKKLSDDLGVKQSVKFLGGVYDPKLLGQYLMESTVYVLAGMGGLSINDAMCFGLPVICSVCDGTEKKLVRDNFNGKYFIENDESDLVDKILYILEFKSRRDEMGKNSEKIICDEINIHTVVNGYIKAFEHVTGKTIANN